MLEEFQFTKDHNTSRFNTNNNQERRNNQERNNNQENKCTPCTNNQDKSTNKDHNTQPWLITITANTLSSLNNINRAFLNLITDKKKTTLFINNQSNIEEPSIEQSDHTNLNSES